MRIVASALLALSVLWGCGCAKKANSDNLVIRVTATYPGANAQVVAETIAAPIEQQVNGVEGATLLESESRGDGTYTLTVHLASTMDPNVAQVLVQNRVSLAEPQLPEECRRLGVVISKETNPPSSPVRIAVCDTKRQGADELLKTANRLAGQMKAKNTAADVTVLLEPAQPKLVIRVDRERLEMLGVSMDDVLKVIRDTGVAVEANDVNKFGREYSMRIPPEPIFAGKDWAKLQVRGAEGRLVSLGAVMSVEEVRVPRQVYRVNLYPAAVLTANSPEGMSAKDATTRSLKLAETELPKGFTAETLLPASR